MCCTIEGRVLSDLMIAYQAGEGEAFCQLYVALRPTLAGDLVSLGADVNSLDALIDEVFLAIHAARRSWSPGSPVQRWAGAIARHVFRQDRARRRARRGPRRGRLEIALFGQGNRRE